MKQPNDDPRVVELARELALLVGYKDLDAARYDYGRGTELLDIAVTLLQRLQAQQRKQAE